MSEASEWIMGRPPLYVPQADVWLENGSVRRVMNRNPYCFQLHFTDCTHPLQNIFCDRDRVRAWRFPAKKETP